MTLSSIPEKVYHNYRISTKEGMFVGLAIGLVNPFLGLFAIAMAAPNIVIGMITSLPAFINLLMMIPAARFIDGYSYKLPLVYWGRLFSRIFYLPMAFIPFLPEFRGQVFVLLLALMTIPAVILNLAWTSMMSQIIPVKYRGDLFSRRNMWCGLITMLGTISAGLLLDIIPHPYNWSTIFILAFIASLTSAFIIKKQEEEEPEEPPMRRPYVKQLKGMLQSENGKQLMLFFATSFVIHLGLNYSAPLFAIYFGRELEISNTLVGWMATTASLTTVISSMFWGKKISLHGTDMIFAISAFGLAVWPAIFSLNAHPAYMIILHGIIGIFIGGFNLTIFNLILSSTSYRFSSASIATFHTLVALTGVIGPFLGTLSLNIISIQSAFITSTIIRILGVAIFAYSFRDKISQGLQKNPKTY